MLRRDQTIRQFVLIADLWDLESFGRAVLLLRENPDVAQRIGQAARQRVIGVCTPDTSLRP